MSRAVRIAVALGLALVATESPAADWTAEIVEDEGGPRMMASVVGPGTGSDYPPELFMFCGAAGEVNLRYAFSAGEGVELPIDEPLPFTFEFGTGAVTLDMQYEGMDGAYAAYFPADHRIIELLKSAATVIVDDPTGKFRVQAFPLTGSSDAIDTLLARCD